MSSRLVQKLENKAITKNGLLREVEQDFNLLPELLEGTSSSKASVRYGCAGILMNLSEKYPEKLYPHMDFFIELLESKHRILVWNALAIIANLTKVDGDRKFDAAFNKYYRFLSDEYMVTVANVVGNSGKIAMTKPHLIPKITKELLKVDKISTTPHLTEECRRVITEKTIKTFDIFYDRVHEKTKVLSFVRRNVNSPRKSLKNEAERFLTKWAK